MGKGRTDAYRYRSYEDLFILELVNRTAGTILPMGRITIRCASDLAKVANTHYSAVR